MTDRERLPHWILSREEDMCQHAVNDDDLARADLIGGCEKPALQQGNPIVFR